MKANCHNCGKLEPLDPAHSLCLDCLVAKVKGRPMPEVVTAAPFDPKAAQLPSGDA